MTGESASFRLIPTRHIGDGELANEQTTNTKTAAIFIAHGYADAGVTKEGVAQTLEDISRAQETPPQFLSAEEKTKSSFFMLNPKEALTHIKQDFDKRRRAGKSGVLTSYVSCMALALASQPEDFSAIDIISPTLKRHLPVGLKPNTLN